MTLTAQVNQLEREVKRIERDLTKIRFALQELKVRKKRVRLEALQESIASHLVSDEDPVQVLMEMRRHNRP
jgi:septal ring factor EnvC (AmiA/AmiB activator)